MIRFQIPTTSNNVNNLLSHRYLWYFRGENDAAFEDKVMEMAKTAGLEKISMIGDGKRLSDFILLSKSQYKCQ